MADSSPLLASDSLSKDSIDIMNDPQYATNSGGGEDGTGDADTCRICRGEATTQEPLFYPCKCSGSIKYVHQDCLMEWLSHSQKKHCELCKTPFRFTKLYSPNMPPNLPTHVFFQHLIIHAAKNVAIWLRACLVLFVWLGLLPWVMRHVWGLLFWFGDGGWTSTNIVSGPDTTSITEAILLAQEQFVILAGNATSPASPMLATPTTSAHLVRLLDQLPKFTFNWTSSDPLTSSFRKMVSYSLGLHGLTPGENITALTKVSRINDIQLASSVKQSSLLSEMRFLKNLTRWSRFNTVVITTLEGQIITLVVVVCFVLIFLIREWVVQQQPGINMGAGFNVDLAGRNGIAQPDALPIHAGDPEGAADENDRIRRDVAGRAIARPRRRQVRFEEGRINDPEQRPANLPDLSDVASIEPTEGELNGESSSSIQGDSSLAANDTLSDTHLDAGQFVEVWRRAGGNPDEVLRIIEAENLGEKLRYWKTSLKLLRDRQTQLSNISDTTHSDVDSVSNIGVLGSLGNPTEDNASSDSWVDIPDTIPESEIPGSSSSFPEDEKIMPGSRKGKEKETTEMRHALSIDWNEREISQHMWSLEQLSELEDGLNNSFGFQAALGRPRALSDGPKVQSSISQLGKNSWTFSNLPTIMNPDGQSTESNPLAVSRSTLEQLPIGEVPEGTATGESSFLEAIPDLEIYQSLVKSGEQDLSGTVESEPVELYNPETGEISTAENWDEYFARNPVEGPEGRDDHLAGEEINNPFHPDGLLPEDAQLLEPRGAPIAPQQENLGLLGAVADWLWGDAVPGGNIPVGDDEHIVHDLAAEAPFVPVVHNVQNMVAGVDEEIPNPDHDRELAEALAAGIDPADPDAIDDAEDFEGIMELVGMRGPLTQLFQNGLFSAVLISLTVACGVWMPYNFGRLFLLLIANPIHTIKIPLALLFSCAAILQDLGLVLLGGISYAFLWIFSLVTTFSPDKFTPTLPNWSGAYEPIKIASSALDRVVELMISSLVKVTASEVPTFSAMSHEALLHIKSVLFSSIRFLSVLFTNTAGFTASGMGNSDINSTSTSTRTLALNLGRACWNYLGEMGLALSSADTWVMTFDSPHRATAIDPILSYWNGRDRFWAIIAGYVALSFVGAAYLRRNSPFSTSQTGREWEATIVDILNQAGGVMKVILIISIEMLVFPLYCGLLLDLALLPLFENATIVSRILFTLETPLTSIFVHWFVGTCYMFHFALFVSMCRKIMRPGVLYFIRDPDDPTFHPVRDVLERNVATQLRKITFSAMVYGALVVICLGGVVWSIAFAFKGVLPIHWSSNEPVLQFPIDLLFYNFFMPLAVKFFKPSDGLHSMYSWWFRKCARILRLTWFLFDKRRVDEEGHHLRQGWARLFYNIHEGVLELFRPLEVDINQEEALNDNFLRDGKYVRTPASDQVRIPKGQQVFVEVDEENKRIDGKSELDDARLGDNYKLVYIPPYFRTRIFLFILSIWLFAAVTGVGITIVPLVFGRFVFAKIIPTHIRKNDVYAFAIGSYVLGSLLYCAIHLRGGLRYIRNALAVNENTTKMVIRRVCTFTIQVLRVIYAYTAFVFVIPTLLTLVMEFYFIIPLHTYFAPSESHVIHFVQSWTLGLLYVKIGTHLILWHSASRPAEALRAVTRNGYFDPDIRIATRAFILPATIILAVALTLPIGLAAGANRFDLFGAGPEAQRKVYRYAFPFTLSLMVHLMGIWTAVGVMKGWRMKIRDEVYLIGERLHNFGDRSRSGVSALVPTGSRIEAELGN